jgi:uncharacterized protein YdhG (YjbR/CyaY superfamily)
MAEKKEKFESVEAYIKSFPAEIQKKLQLVRKAIKSGSPEAEEVISYQMPAFRFNGWIFYYSAYKDHYSLSCPPPFTVFEKFKEALAEYVVTKSAIKFPFDRPVPTKLITDMSKFRAVENKSKGKGGKKTKD